MSQLHFPWLELAILAPLLGALVVATQNKGERAMRIAVGFSLLSLILSVGEWIDFVSLETFEAHDHGDFLSWIFRQDIIVVDELSAPLLPMAALGFFVVILSTLKTKIDRFSFGWTLVSEAILLATISCKTSWILVGLLVVSIAPEALLRSVALLSLFTAFYAAGMATIQREARRFFCYLFLSNASMVLVGIELVTPVGVTGSLCVWFSVGISLAGFGICLRSVEARIGRVSLADYHGLYEQMPSIAGFFLLTGLASIGFPGTIGFIAMELLIEGAVEIYPLVGTAIVLAAALNGISILNAAGLIVIVLGCVQDFGGDGMAGGFSDQDMMAYQAALAVSVVAALLQIGFALLRGGILGDFFPGAAVHGMLAAIGFIIMLKQFPVALGVTAKGEPLELLRHLPNYLLEANPAIATIGLTSLAIMFGWPWIAGKFPKLKIVPSQVIVLAVAIPMGMAFDLLHEHSYVLANHESQLGENFLVAMPKEMFGMFRELKLPLFSVLVEWKAWKWIFLFFVIGSLESLLSAKAVESLDPYRRKTNLNRDLLSVGIGNLASAFVGGLPMISEIVRSRANIDNGAKTRYSNFWHGIFLLVCVALLPTFLHLIPLSALAAMLVYTGFRLAHPREFLDVYKIGREQLLIFVVTIIAVLATDLLIGVLIGIGLKMVLHLANGVPLSSIFKPYLEVEQLDEKNCLIRAHQSAIFSNWIPFRRQIEDLGLVQRQNITIDLSDTKMVDHSTIEKLHEMQHVFESEGLELKVTGLENLRPLAGHAKSARVGGLVRMRRLTVVTHASLAKVIESIGCQHEIASYIAQECRGKTAPASVVEADAAHPTEPFFRIEVVAPNRVCEAIVAKIRKETSPSDPITVYTEAIDLMYRPSEIG